MKALKITTSGRQDHSVCQSWTAEVSSDQRILLHYWFLASVSHGYTWNSWLQKNHSLRYKKGFLGCCVLIAATHHTATWCEADLLLQVLISCIMVAIGFFFDAAKSYLQFQPLNHITFFEIQILKFALYLHSDVQQLRGEKSPSECRTFKNWGVSGWS